MALCCVRNGTIYVRNGTYVKSGTFPSEKWHWCCLACIAVSQAEMEAFLRLVLREKWHSCLAAAFFT
jgi:hypothetical protein